MKFPNEIINRHISACKAAAKRLIDKGAAITEVVMRTGFATDGAEHREEGALLIYGTADSGTHKPVFQEAQSVCREYEKSLAQAEAKLGEPYEGSNQFALHLDFCDSRGNSLPKLYRHRLAIDPKRLEANDQVLLPRWQDALRDYLNEGLGKQISFYKAVVHALVSKGKAEMKYALVKTEIEAGRGRIDKTGESIIRMEVANENASSFLAEYENLENSYDSFRDCMESSLHLIAKNNDTKTYEIRFRYMFGRDPEDLITPSPISLS